MPSIGPLAHTCSGRLALGNEWTGRCGNSPGPGRILDERTDMADDSPARDLPHASPA